MRVVLRFNIPQEADKFLKNMFEIAGSNDWEWECSNSQILIELLWVKITGVLIAMRAEENYTSIANSFGVTLHGNTKRRGRWRFRRGRRWDRWSRNGVGGIRRNTDRVTMASHIPGMHKVIKHLRREKLIQTRSRRTWSLTTAPPTPQHDDHHHLFTHSSNPTRSPLLLLHRPLLRPLQWPSQLLLLPLLSLSSKSISLGPLSLPHRRPTVLHPRQNRPRSVLCRRPFPVFPDLLLPQWNQFVEEKERPSFSVQFH